MGKISISSLIIWCVLIYIYLVGGSLQFFFDLSFTISAAVTAVSLLSLYFTYSFLSQKIVYNKLIRTGLIAAVFILVSGFLNNTSWFKTLLYLTFIVYPISTYVTVRYFISPQLLDKITNTFFIVIGLIQTPILLLQNYGYDYLIRLKGSSQEIAAIDFNFGTFFLKNDHGLGFFLLCLILYLWYDPKGKSIRNRTTLTSIYVFAILLTNSTISHLLLFILLAYIFYTILKPKVLILIISSMIIIMAIPLAAFTYFQIPGIKDRIENFAKDTSYNRAIQMYEEGVATRTQTLVVFLNEKINWIGNGPFSYFDITTGTFYQNPNFSQWLWFYFDVGLLGVVLLFWFLLKFDIQIDFDRKYSHLILSMLFIYALFTTITTDLTFMFTYYLFYRREQQSYEYNYSALS